MQADGRWLRCLDWCARSFRAESKAPLNPVGLSSLMAIQLRVLTRDAEASRNAVNAPLSHIPCSETYGCQCDTCEAERAFLVGQGSKDRIQPWQHRSAA